MTMRLPKFDKKNPLSSIPTLFWVIIFVALVLGLIFAGATKLITDRVATNGSGIAIELPAYVRGIQSSSKDEQISLRKSLIGSWATEKGDTRMILEFDPKGSFILRVSEKQTPFYILLAHGLYSSFNFQDDDNKVFLLSERRNDPIPLQKPAPYYKFRSLDVVETAFIWNLQNGALVLKLAQNPTPQENFMALFKDFANGQEEVVFKRIVRKQKQSR